LSASSRDHLITGRRSSGLSVSTAREKDVAGAAGLLHPQLPQEVTRSSRWLPAILRQRGAARGATHPVADIAG
jgi:hypothetical protein